MRSASDREEITAELVTDLSLLAGPGEALPWWGEPTEQEQWDAAWVRKVWSGAVGDRNRMRNALTALGFEQVERTRGTAEHGHVLPVYTERWVGSLGELLIQWD